MPLGFYVWQGTLVALVNIPLQGGLHVTSNNRLGAANHFKQWDPLLIASTLGAAFTPGSPQNRKPIVM